MSTLFTALGPVGTHLLAAAAIFGPIYAFFRWINGVVNEETKIEVAVWLLDSRPNQNPVPWPATFAKIFDRVFGKKHVSPECFLKSCLMTVIVACLISFVLAILNKFGFTWFLIQIALVVSGNLIPDYFSLLKTRFLLGIFSSYGLAYTFPFLLVDLVICLLCSCLATLTVLTLVSIIDAHAFDPSILSTFLEFYGFCPSRAAATLQGENYDNGFLSYLRWLFVLPSFVPLIWTVGYLFVGLFFKGLLKIKFLYSWVLDRFDIENKPIEVIGALFGGACVVIYGIGLIFAG